MFIYFSNKNKPISQHLYTYLLYNKITINKIKTFLKHPLKKTILTKKIIKHFKKNTIKNKKII